MQILLKNETKLLFLFFIFLFFLPLYYIYLFRINRHQIIKNDLKKNQVQLENKQQKIQKNKTEKIENLQKEIKKIFINSNKKPFFDLLPHRFEKGEIVYAFNLDIEGHMQSFQEGIVSEDYEFDDTRYLPISIKGKNNKIFFNKEGQFIGISAPNQDPDAEINYIITSNSIFYFSKCDNEEIDDQLESYDENINNSEKYYYFFVKFEKNSKFIKHKIFLDENGLFLGLHQKMLKKNFLMYILDDLKCQKCRDQLKKEFKQRNNEIQNKKNKDNQREQIHKLDKITFLITFKNYLENYLGSGFIFNVDNDENNSLYTYYILTNRHVIQKAKQNDRIKIFNSFFYKKDVELFGFIKNSDIYDDIAILTFKDNNKQKFEEINLILKEVLPQKKINFYQGETVYSMGSQISELEEKKLSFIKKKYHDYHVYDNDIMDVEDDDTIDIYDDSKTRINLKLNLLKKGNIVDCHEKEISFDIQIDSGNSGGPVFNTKGEIIGMNKSSISVENYIPDKTSQCINIQHIKKICNKIFQLHKKIPDKYFFEILNEDYDFLKNEFNSFMPLSSDNCLESSKYKENISFSIQELVNYFEAQNKKSIKSRIIPKKEKEIKLNITLIFVFQEQEQIFSIDPTKEQIEINWMSDKKEIIFKKYFENRLKIIKKYNIEKLGFNTKNEPFFSLKLIYPENLDDNILENNKDPKLFSLQKIKNSLIVWEQQNKRKSGNGIIFQKNKISNDIFLYFVLSTYNINKNKLEHITEPIKNIFIDEINITTFYNENYKKEKGEIKSFFFGNHNLVLIIFESSHDYDIVRNRPIEDLNLGEEIFCLINNDNDDYVPQMFKSTIGNKEKDYILCDSIFDLNKKNKKNHSNLNLLYFDSEANLIGINDNLEDDKNKIPKYFTKVSFLKEKDIENLIKYSKFKDNLSLFFAYFFIFIILFIIIVI